MGNSKGFPVSFFAMATLLICSNSASSLANHTAVQQEQQPTFYNGWSYFFEHPGTSAGAQSSKKIDVQAEEELTQQAAKQGSSSQCGKGPTMPARSLIDEKVGGSGATTATGPWPFLVNLRKSTDPAGVFFCSGSLISKLHVLLAAQCLEKLATCEISCLTVLLGQTNQNGPSVAMTRRVASYVVHSLYNPFNYANDIAIITMDAPVPFSKNIYPVCLPPASNQPDQHVDTDAAVMGWGPETLGAPATTLKQGKVFIVDLFSCMATPSSFSQYVSSLNICVLTSTKLTCVQDIGGPVVINTAAAGMIPQWTQVGINSYTKNCASNGLKTRVTAFRDWIFSIAGV